MKVSLYVGDSCNDGHGRIERLLVDVNVTYAQLTKAYKKGTKKLGLDFELKVANEYSGKVLNEGIHKKLTSLGWVAPNTFKKKRELDPELYFDIWIFLAKLGNAGLVVNVKPRRIREMYIGGIGLFGEES